MKGFWSLMLMLFLIMFTAKIFEVSDISWWWMLAPFWAPFLVAFFLICFVALFGSLLPPKYRRKANNVFDMKGKRVK